MLRPKKVIGPILVIVVLLAAFAARELGIKLANDLDQKEFSAYILTIDKVYKLAEVRKEVRAWLDSNKQALEAMEDDKALVEGTFARRARALDAKYPDVGRIVRKQGMSTREYLLGNAVLVQSILLADAEERGELESYSKVKRSVDPANLKFVEQHAEEIRQSMQDLRFRM